MSKLSYKIAWPVVLAGSFVTIILIAFNYEKLSLAEYIIIILLFIFMFFFGFATGQRFVDPVKKILNKAIDLSEGETDARVYLETKDEFSDLAKVFNKIAQKLEDSKINEEKAEQSIDIKVRARTKALEETISALEQKVQNRTIELEKITKDLEKLKSSINTSK